MNPRNRQRFDRLLEQVLAALPPAVHGVLERVPLHVEDYPPDDVLRQMSLEYRDELCGLYSGVPLTERYVDGFPVPDVVTVYREGILAAAEDRHGRLTADAIRGQIRTTILHELAHYHGLTEDELKELGYE